MRKAIKIGLITITIIILVITISASVLLWIVFTPAKLTPIVRNQIDKYIGCPSEIGEVELTFFSTFPQFGLKTDQILLTNILPEASSDTLLWAKNATASIDINALWKKNELIIKEVEFSVFRINAFVNKQGKANYDVYISDTTQTDTSSFKNPFEKIDLRNLSFRNGNISYNNVLSGVRSSITNLNGDLNFVMRGSNIFANINLSTPKISLATDSIEYLKDAKLKTKLPLQFYTENGLLSFDNSKITINELTANFNGNIKYSDSNGDITTAITFHTESCMLKPILNLIPKQYAAALNGIKTDGLVTTTGKVSGIYNDNSMPLFDMNVQMENGTFEYDGLQYKLRDIIGDADVKLDLNNDSASHIIINDIKAKTGESNLQGNGTVNYILADDMDFDLNLKMGLNLAELEPMMPSDMKIKLRGWAQGDAKAVFKLSEAMDFNLEKMNISGKFDASNLTVTYDSLTLNADKAKLDLSLPGKKGKPDNFLTTGIWLNKGKIFQGKNTELNISNGNFWARTTNITETDRMNTIFCDFNFGQMLVNYESMVASMEQSKGKLEMQANFSDTISIPTVKCNFDVKSLTASMDTMSVKINQPKGEFSMKGMEGSPSRTVFDIDYNSLTTTAQMGNQSMNAEKMSTKANIIYDANEKNTLLQWIPTGNISMHNAKLKVNGLNARIEIPTIQFDFKPDEYIIKSSKFIVDNSDFELTGKLWNVTKYLRNEGLLSGDFNFISKTTDVYRLMELTNGLGVEDTASIATNATTESTSSGPYMVPKGMDIKLHTKVDQVLLGFDSAKNIIGDLIIKDGLMVLEDMRFSTSAAKMQITAMYRTPRRNHLFVGMDFHMTDTEISELLKMVPDIDTIMPMLRSFGGKGDFHIAVETYLDSAYHLKKSTLRGVSSIKGENLVLMDGETFSEIAKTLRFNKKTENRVDSLSAEFTIFKNEVDIYPFLIVMDKYKAVIAGRHNLDMTFNYHISITDSPLPFRLGVNVTGTLDDMKIRPAKCKYANLYRPAARREIDTKQLEIRKMIRDALTKEVIK